MNKIFFNYICDHESIRLFVSINEESTIEFEYERNKYESEKGTLDKEKSKIFINGFEEMCKNLEMKENSKLYTVCGGIKVKYFDSPEFQLCYLNDIIMKYFDSDDYDFDDIKPFLDVLKIIDQEIDK